MTQIRSAKDLEKFIDYEFNNPKILDEARRRKAFLNENPSQDDECMDPLATLGDAVLDTIVILQLYKEGKRTKQELTEGKILQVKRERTRAFAHDHDLHEYIQWGEGELKQKHWTQGNKALDTVTEALIGAIFLDAENRRCDGLKTVQKFLEAKNFFEKRQV
jgi:ribonuclease-3